MDMQIPVRQRQIIGTEKLVREKTRRMTKVRTVIPINAKPGKSVIQVTNPLTGKPVRAKVPKDAIPGQTVELDIPDDPTELDNATTSTARDDGQSTADRRSSEASNPTGTKTPEISMCP